MKIPKPVTIDFETWGIEDRPAYPPLPCGVSIKWPGSPARYYAFGHREGNNCSWGEATAALARAYAHPDGVCCQNGKFDVDVAEVHLGLPVPRWQDLHDTMFLIFLDDPHQQELGLKPTVQRLFGEPPAERDAVIDWLVEHQPVPGVKISRSKQSDHYAMKYLPLAPGGLVGEYANDDTTDTERVFDHLYAKTVERGMLAAYDRERRLMPILLKMERRGLPVDLERLAKDVETYSWWQLKLDEWLKRYLKAPDVNLDSGEQLMEAMAAAGKVDLTVAPRTATGKLASNKDALLVAVSDVLLLALLRYRAQLKTALGTFMKPWLRMAQATGGTIHTLWHQVRSPKGDDTSGARTGRLSATWFMNMPKEFKDARKDLKKLPAALVELPALPNCRSYIVPGAGRVLIDRDYSQQEPRILGHFEGGALQDQYVADPWLDLHDNARDELAKAGKVYERKPVKNTNLGLIYGMGVGKLAAKNDMSVLQAKDLKNAILKLYPGLKELYADMKYRMRANLPIRTWGGREIFCEPPLVVDGKLRHFDYKMVNMLIQGSAADCTKEAIIRFDEAITAAGHEDDWWILLLVHDQLTTSVPGDDGRKAMELQRTCMESVEFDVQILSEGAVSYEHWAALVDVDKKGKELPWPKAPPSSRSSRSRPGRSAPTTSIGSARPRSSTPRSSSSRSLPTPPWQEATTSTNKLRPSSKARPTRVRS
jgi:DNA polymerase I-like protein with 3'-5' exonuclease and polymerase domains